MKPFTGDLPFKPTGSDRQVANFVEPSLCCHDTLIPTKPGSCRAHGVGHLLIASPATQDAKMHPSGAFSQTPNYLVLVRLSRP
jgi:hypothetical protein